MRYPFTELEPKQQRKLTIQGCEPGKFYRCVLGSEHATVGKVYMCVQYLDEKYGPQRGIVGDNFLVYTSGNCRFEEVN